MGRGLDAGLEGDNQAGAPTRGISQPFKFPNPSPSPPPPPPPRPPRARPLTPPPSPPPRPLGLDQVASACGVPAEVGLVDGVAAGPLGPLLL
eukprot:3997611-Pyramimonas_sp.AAC.1